MEAAEGHERDPGAPRRGAGALPKGNAAFPGLPELSRSSWVLLGASLLFGLVAYRKILTARDQAAMPLEFELEGWFFYPSHTIPLVILLLALWLLYRRIDQLKRLEPVPGPRWLSGGLLLLGTALLGWATYTRALDLVSLSLVVNGLGLAALYGGAAAMRVLLLPLGFMVFAMSLPAPFLNAVLYHLQIWTAELTGWLLHRLGMTALVSGDQILMEVDRFAIVENCSGLRSVETLTMLAILLVDLYRRAGVHAALILVAAPLVAFLLNSFRALTLILNPHSEIVAIHNVQGIAILLIGLLLIYLLDGVLARFLPQRDPPFRERPARPGSAPNGRGRLAVATGVLAAAALLSIAVSPWEPVRPPYPPLTSKVFGQLGPWSSEAIRVDRAFLGRASFRGMLYRRYRSGQDVVDLFVGSGDRTQRRSSPVSPKTKVPGSGWIIEAEGRARLGAGGPEVETRVVRSNTRRFLIYHWYRDMDGLWAESLRSLAALDSSRFRKDRDTSVLRLSTRIRGDEATDLHAAEERLLRFYEALEDELERL